MKEEASVNNLDDEDDYHEVTFAPSGVPGGTFLRGKYKARSLVKENGVLIWSYKWTLEVIKRDPLLKLVVLVTKKKNQMSETQQKFEEW